MRLQIFLNNKNKSRGIATVFCFCHLFLFLVVIQSCYSKEGVMENYNIYFSPTYGTEKVAIALADGLQGNFKAINLCDEKR